MEPLKTIEQSTWRSLRDAIAPALSSVISWLILIYALIAAFIPQQLLPTLSFSASALLSTSPYIIFAALAVGYLFASGASAIIGERLQSGSLFTIMVAALIGSFVPLCSCEVIPFIAALLAAGVPVWVVMAFWLSAPLMDPAGFLITTSALGLEFAIGKTIAALAVGLFGGFSLYAIARQYPGLYENTLKPSYPSGGGCAPKKGKAVWKFWVEKDRVAVFRKEFLSNLILLLKWLALAYTLEALLIEYLPAELIISLLGNGNNVLSIFAGAILGAPAYLNGYAAPAIVSGFVAQGMSVGAAMSFLVAGGVTSIPAMTAVFAIARRQVFISYLVLGFIGAILSGFAFLMFSSG